MKELYFKVITRKKLKNLLTLQQTKRFPAHEMTFYHLQDSMVIVEYQPTSKFDDEKFVDFMIRYLKRNLNAHSVENVVYANNQIGNIDG